MSQDLEVGVLGQELLNVLELLGVIEIDRRNSLLERRHVLVG